MTAIGKMVAVGLLNADCQVLHYQNWTAQTQTSIHTLEWLIDTVPGVLNTLHDGALSLDLSHFNLGGSLTTDDWEDQWLSIIFPIAGTPVLRLLLSISEPICVELTPRLPFTPPFLTLNVFVDAQRFPVADNPFIGLDDITRNSLAITGWFANYVYAMLPKCKPHMKKKCEDYPADTKPFRKHGKIAYVTGYFHGFCNKSIVFSESCTYNPLEFVPLIEILKIDWTAGEPRQHPGTRDLLGTPSKSETPDRGRGKFIFDTLAQMTANAKGPTTPSKSSG
ncbi:hypothetical protein CORC01_14226 [Colletotrichum orchidophilum]|uniref:Uncharacterized protein n=1 Tax=Colletotrichum orchidophilum TaxID=1209926 RepID=A0A1G4AN17_9PEZI|nr:uncharacterized protein CORC01_14226 [Colletotrichum orchidophilum]OHE90475.1 hypothetical protein CORC01_14226 [Colletotrichum orchidophilum]